LFLSSSDKTKKSLNGKLISLYNSVPFSSFFMTNNMASGMKKHYENIEPESRQTAKMFSFFFFSQASSKLCSSFTIAFAQNSSILH